MPRKRKNSEEEDHANASSSGDVYEKGGRVLRVRDTCQCPMCGIYFSPTEITAHAQACLYFMEHESEGKKKSKKGISTSADSAVPSPTKVNLSKSDSAIKTNANASPTKASPQKIKPVQVEWKPNTVASWNVPYAPVFKPTLAEFKSPLEYISKIRPTAEKYGICVIVPPYPAESWNKNIGDPKTFTFRTKVQNIHQLKTRWQGRNEIFVSNLASFLEKRGEPLRSMPKVDGRDLDLYKLFTSVVNRGGYQVVERANLWKSVADDLKLSVNSVRNNALRNHYHKYLFAYEMHRKSKLQYKPASTSTNDPNAKDDDDLYIAHDITDDLYNTDYLEEEDGEDEFGFYEGEEYTLAGFEKKARSFSEKWFPNKPTPEQVEEEFWRIVETAEDSVKVDYGSDLDVTKINRSGFSRDQCIPGKELGPYITEDHTHWNLNHLPRMKGSVLSHIGESIAGVTDPMLYIGMLFSSFCWHTEDNYLYSINYMHKGTAKTWYGIPAYAAEQFEEVMKAAVPDLFVKHPDLLHLLITMVAPSVLVANKVPIVRAVQEPGQYVITFPKAYHAGFSHGFTCAEAVNFAPADWLPFGQESVLHYRNIKRQSVFSHEELVCTIAKRDPPPETAFWLTKELTKIKEREQSSRDTLRLAGFFIQVLGPNEPKEEPKQCKICGYDCYLSHIYCSCSPQATTCLFHHAELCNTCSVKSKFLKVLVPLSDLDVLLEKTQKLQIQARSYIDLTEDDDTPAPVPTFPTSSSYTSTSYSSTFSTPSPPTSTPSTSALPPASPKKPASTPTPSAPSPMDIDKPSSSAPSASSPAPSSSTAATPSSTPAPSSSTPAPSSSTPASPSPVNEPPTSSSVNSDAAAAAQPVHTPPSPSTSPTLAPSASPTPSSTSPTPSSTSLAPSTSVSSPPASTSPASPTPGSPPAPKFGIVINLSQDKSSQPSGTPPRTPTGTPPRSSPQNTPPSPHLSDHLQGIALNVPPSISGYGKSTPKPSSGLSKPVHIVIDSPTKA